MFMLHDEIDRIPGLAAAKAFVDPLDGGDRERRGFFVMERAQPDLVDTASPQVDKISDHLLDAGGLDDVVDGFVRDHFSGIGYGEGTTFEEIFCCFQGFWVEAKSQKGSGRALVIILPAQPLEKIDNQS
jgi:hypothetical protein